MNTRMRPKGASFASHHLRAISSAAVVGNSDAVVDSIVKFKIDVHAGRSPSLGCSSAAASRA